MIICKKENCTGCFACVNACPTFSIKMEEGEKGHIYPQIDESSCIGCNKCTAVCPSLKEKINGNQIKDCYLMWSEDENIRQNSTSGGAAYIMSYGFIKEGGVVYGAGFDETGNVKHIRVDNVADLKRLQGSKYVQSHIEKAYSLAENDLKNGKQVLFIAMPCQIAGLKSYLGKNYDELFTCDLICHGVPSQKCFKEDAKNVLKVSNLDGYSFTFRDSNASGMNYTAFKDGKQFYSKPFYNSLFYLGFEKGYLQRESCYNCRYASTERVSDITIGDFWGVKDISEQEIKKGTSVLLINSSNGEKIKEKMSLSVFLQKREIDEALAGNIHLKKPVSKPEKEKEFVSNYSERPFEKAISKLLFKDKIKYRFLYEVVVKTPLKKILGGK